MLVRAAAGAWGWRPAPVFSCAPLLQALPHLLIAVPFSSCLCLAHTAPTAGSGRLRLAHRFENVAANLHCSQLHAQND